MNNTVKIALIVVLLGGAAYLGWANMGGPSQTDSIMSRPVYVLCKNKACRNEIEMTQGQLNEIVKSGEEMPCPKCSKKELDFALPCPSCKRFVLLGAHGATPKVCPNCKQKWPMPKSQK